VPPSLCYYVQSRKFRFTFLQFFNSTSTHAFPTWKWKFSLLPSSQSNSRVDCGESLVILHFFVWRKICLRPCDDAKVEAPTRIDTVEDHVRAFLTLIYAAPCSNASWALGAGRVYVIIDFKMENARFLHSFTLWKFIFSYKVSISIYLHRVHVQSDAYFICMVKVH